MLATPHVDDRPLARPAPGHYQERAAALLDRLPVVTLQAARIARPGAETRRATRDRALPAARDGQLVLPLRPPSRPVRARR